MMNWPKIVALTKGLVPLVVVLLMWQFIWTDSSVHFPEPSSWWKAIAMLVASGAFLPALGATLSIVVVSLLVAGTSGVLLGLLIGTFATLREWTSLLLEYLRAVPPPVVIPIAVLALGYTTTMKVLVIGFAAFWPIMLNTIAGVLQIREITLDVARAFKLSRFDTMVKIIMPAVIPSVLLGLRVALPQALVVTLVVEMFTGEAGIGSLMIAAQRNFNAPGVFGLLAVMGILGYCLTASFSLAERIVVQRWPSSP
jgi:ABC-type nitrate/sulfonate/bicarbonate transport system permease component